MPIKTATIRVMLPTRSGSPRWLEIKGQLEVQDLTEHELAGVLFACEFAINDHAGAIFGQDIRAHIDTKE